LKGDLVERRQKMVRQRAKGLPLNMVVNQLSNEYSRTKQALYKDWRNRKIWIKGILDLDDPETVFFDFYTRHEEIYQMTVMEYYKADNSSAKVGALRLAAFFSGINNIRLSFLNSHFRHCCFLDYPPAC
jgi:hypothetical protein